MAILVIFLLWWVETGLRNCECVDLRLELGNNRRDLGVGVLLRIASPTLVIS